MKTPLRILLLGATGQIGRELKMALAPGAEVITPNRQQLNCEDESAVRRFLFTASPHCVINAAAYTRVDDAERDRAECQRLNEALPAVLAEICATLKAGLVHFSTDYVFDGNAHRPYREDDSPSPLNWYGATKLAGEEGVATRTDMGLVLRTSWIYGLTGRNFLRTIMKLAREREEISVVNDQIGSPTSSAAVAAAAATIVMQLGLDREAWRAANGVYHLTAAGQTSWHGFASRILDTDPGRSEHRVRALPEVSTSQYPTPAKRPAYSVLDNTRVMRRFGIALDPWQQQLESVFNSRVDWSPLAQRVQQLESNCGDLGLPPL